MERDYTACIWPCKYITPQKNEKTYYGRVSPLCVDEKNKGKSTEPIRFSDIDLTEREVSYGKSGFAMQFMLDSRLSDIDRFPLKINDLLIMDIDDEVAPEKVVWRNLQNWHGPEMYLM